MVLVDTSVWIRFFSRRSPEQEELDRLLDRYLTFPSIPVVPHEELVEFVTRRRLHGRGVSWIDAHLLAAVFTSGLKLWTADVRLEQLAREVGVAYDIPPLNSIIRNPLKKKP